MFSRYGVTVSNIFGFPLILNWTWVIFMVLVAVLWPKILLMYSLAFVFVTIHEYCHALTAQWCGHKVHSISLWPLGGLARMEIDDISPKHEFLIIAAGPLSNIVMGLALWPLALVGFTGVIGQLIISSLYINFVLAFFNLLPAFPMDGGRLLRAFLTQVTGDKLWATKCSVAVSCLFVAAAVYLSFVFGNLVWGLLAAFVLIAGFAELQHVQNATDRTVLRKVLAEMQKNNTLLNCQPKDLLRAILSLEEPTRAEFFAEFARLFPEVIEEKNQDILRRGHE